MIRKLKRKIAVILSMVMIINLLTGVVVTAETEADKYPYTMFASSDEEGAICINASYLCMNGDIATNGTVSLNGNGNVNGSIIENVGEGMIYATKKINYRYFSDANCENFEGDYLIDEGNININNAIRVLNGALTVSGNASLNGSLAAYGDISISGENINANNSVIVSENGNITISGSNVSLTGLIYAPKGNVYIGGNGVNLNNVIIIADKISVNGNGVNINYNSSMAEFIGTESELELMLFSFGIYESSLNAIEISWITTVDKGNFIVEESSDNETYSEVTTLENEKEYVYQINEEFDIKYFRVTEVTYYGESKTSAAFYAEKTEEGYIVKFIDTDSDLISDMAEELYGTDINNTDTDNDGLSDYEEICETETDPLIFSSVEEGVSDADADIDGDGLSNILELQNSTNPLVMDTDEDGLNDYEEIYVYYTNPTVSDTDEDSLSDGDELPITLNPNNPETYGVPDSEYKLSQTISSDSKVLEEINTIENPYKLSVEVYASGYVEGGIVAQETGYANTINNEAIVGVAPELYYSGVVDSVTLRFEMSKEYVEGIENIYEDSEIQGIKKLNVFKYFEDINMLLPIETEFDLENNVVYATTDELGTYCLVDIEKWLEGMNITVEENVPEPVAFSLYSVEDENEVVEFTPEDMVIEANEEESQVVEELVVPEILTMSLLSDETTTYSTSVATTGFTEYFNVTPVDVVFILQASGQREYVFETQKQVIVNTTQTLIDAYRSNNIRVGVIIYNTNGAEMLEGLGGSNWFSGAVSLQEALDEVEYQVLGDYVYTDRGTAFQMVFDDVEFRVSASKYVFNFINGATNVGGSYFDQLSLCSQMSVNYSEFMPPGFYYVNSNYEQRVVAAIEATNGMMLTYSSDLAPTIFEHINTTLAEPMVAYGAIVPTGWKEILLDGVLDISNNIDTDDDGLTDWEEVNTDLISWEADGTIILPTVLECMEMTEKPYAETGLDRILSAWENGGCSLESYLEFVYVLPIDSDPTEEDSDGDSLLDGSATYVAGRKVAPKDQNLLDYDGEKGLWANHIEEQKNGEVAYNYLDDETMGGSIDEEAFDDFIKKVLKLRTVTNNTRFVWDIVAMYLEMIAGNKHEVGAYFLNFVYDDKYVAYHAKVDTWQRQAGYNEFYDEVFDIGSSMDNDKLDFKTEDGTEYALWLWKGDYWAFGSGAEVGLYEYSAELSGTEHYHAIDFEVPMALSLYNYYSEDNIGNVFNWAPNEEQWWITGFNPKFDFNIPVHGKMKMVAMIDLSEHIELYTGIIDSVYSKDANVDFIFDEGDTKLWITW